MITNFSIFKVADHDGDPKKPTHSISTKVGEKYEYIGKCWTKDGAKGKFLSCNLDTPYKEKAGWKIEPELPQASEPVITMDGRDITDQAF